MAAETGTLWRTCATLGTIRGGTASAVGPKRSEAVRHGCACAAATIYYCRMIFKIF